MEEEDRCMVELFASKNCWNWHMGKYCGVFDTIGVVLHGAIYKFKRVER